ncbi:MAG: hypothetical protein COW40_16390 [Cytophagales bacterium CG17_big_fil_post_rev_8_21_14_2_50_40_13]|nr:MAG: hypothetical protein COW40_16390 [Cytophagales bacterium CG17_big_fil_post_rev_8_21_14_2_50_40_13]
MQEINEEKRMKRINSFLAFVVFLLASIQTVEAQVAGNEWIDYDQTYYKIKTGADDIHRLTYESLLEAGFDFTQKKKIFPF